MTMVRGVSRNESWRRCRNGARRCAALTAVAALLFGGGARASEEEASLHEEALISGRVTRQERPFGFVTDPSTPDAGVLTLGYGFGLGSGISADRPLPVNMATVNGSHTFAVGYGLTSRLAPFASAIFAESAPGSGSVAANIAAGVTYQFTRPVAPLRLSLIAAGIHEGSSGASGFSATAAGSYEVGALKVGANVRGDKVFASGRDKVDLFALLGVSYRVARAIRVGAEYVAQDLEADGGVRPRRWPLSARPRVRFWRDGEVAASPRARRVRHELLRAPAVREGSYRSAVPRGP